MKSMVSRLLEDFRSIWPRVGGGDLGESSITPKRTDSATAEEYESCQTAVSQGRQDAILVALFKNKGSPLDPGSYRGIFLLEVAGKILAGILNWRLQILLDGWMSDLQCGFWKSRGTLQQVLCIMRALQALKEADKVACILFIDFKKAFNLPPRSAIWACLRGLNMLRQHPGHDFPGDGWGICRRCLVLSKETRAVHGGTMQAEGSDRATGIGCLSEEDRMALAVW